MPESLKVAVNHQTIGLLAKENNEFVFNYKDSPPDGFVSLTMPVRMKGYVHPVLHPIFQMHLPEGYLLSIIKKHFSKEYMPYEIGFVTKGKKRKNVYNKIKW